MFTAYHGSRTPGIDRLEATDPPYTGGYGEAVYLARDPATALQYGPVVYRVQVKLSPTEIFRLDEHHYIELPATAGYFSLSVGEDIPPFSFTVPDLQSGEERRYTVVRSGSREQLELWVSHVLSPAIRDELRQRGEAAPTRRQIVEHLIGEPIALDGVARVVRDAGWRGMAIAYPIRRSAAGWVNDEILIFDAGDVEVLEAVDQRRGLLPSWPRTRDVGTRDWSPDPSDRIKLPGAPKQFPAAARLPHRSWRLWPGWRPDRLPTRNTRIDYRVESSFGSDPKYGYVIFKGEFSGPDVEVVQSVLEVFDPEEIGLPGLEHRLLEWRHYVTVEQEALEPDGDEDWSEGWYSHYLDGVELTDESPTEPITWREFMRSVIEPRREFFSDEAAPPDEDPEPDTVGRRRLPENSQFPIRTQLTEWSCGPACVEAVLAYYGIQAEQMDLATELKTDPRTGTEIAQLEQLLTRLGLRFEARPMTVGELRAFVARRVPVICVIQAWPSTGCDWHREPCAGHFVVVVGAGRGWLQVMDPVVGDHLVRWPVADFAERWFDAERGHRSGVAVYGPLPTRARGN